MIEKEKEYVEENVLTSGVERSIGHRFPWLLLGLLGGFLATLITSKYEALLSLDIRLAFFIPIIVYLSDAVGTQTETIYIRFIAKQKADTKKYIFRESIIGFGLGILSGLLFGLFGAFWLKDTTVGLVIGLTMLINLTFAPVLAVTIPYLLHRRHSDPALGAGPVATIIQDIISLVVYFLIADAFLF